MFVTSGEATADDMTLQRGEGEGQEKEDDGDQEKAGKQTV